MTNGELHDILDDENKKISLKEFRDILWKLKEDSLHEAYKLSYLMHPTAKYYCGEVNAFYIALDLSEHIEDEDTDA